MLSKIRRIRFIVFFVILILAMLQSPIVQGANLLKNSSFEKKTNFQKDGQFCQDWSVSFGSRAKQCKAEFSSDAYDGQYSLKLILRGPKADVWAGQKIEVIPGTELYFKLYAKGTLGRAYYVQFMPVVDGKFLKSTWIPFSLPKIWSPLSASYLVPEDVHYVHVIIPLCFSNNDTSLETITLHVPRQHYSHSVQHSPSLV